MRFKDQRRTYVKGLATPDPHDAATPRLLSVYKNGYLRTGLDEKDIMRPKPNRASLRAQFGGPRRHRLPALTNIELPWRAS